MSKTVSFPVKSQTANKSTGEYSVMISTEDIDRSGDIVRAAGVKLENYRKNPIVLFSHSYDVPPIARTTNLEVIPGRGIKATFKFPSEGIHPLADTVRGLFSEGFINAASIGFNPIKSISLDPTRPYGPQEYTEVELLEWSIVPVPANQSALRLAYQKTLRLNPPRSNLQNQALDLGLAATREVIRSGDDYQAEKAVSKFLDLIGAILGKK